MKSSKDKKTILVIDDDIDILRAVTLVLEYSGYKVKTASDGAYASELGKKSVPLPDLILLDVLLSGKDGRVIARELKSRPATAAIPLIMFSAHPSAEKTAHSFGADDFLAKPFDIDTLLKLVEKHLKKASKK